MKSIKSAITIIALVATAFSYGQASAESITVKMESVREDSVEHLFQPWNMSRPLTGSLLVEGLPEIQSVTGLEIHEPLHARLSFKDSPAEPIVIVGQDSDGEDIAFVVADSTAQPQQLQLASDFFDRIQDEALYAELTVPPAGQEPGLQLELFINQGKYNAVLHRNLELRLGEADIGGQRYAIALVRDPSFGTYSLPADSLGLTHELMIDRDRDGVFLTSLYGQTEKLEDEIFEVAKSFLIGGQAYKLSHVSATGDQLVIERSDQTVALAVGFEMPNVIVTRLDSSAIELTALRGKPVVINWWTTFCPPCITEIPELNELVEKYADCDVEFLAIADNEGPELKQFLEEHPFAYDIALADDEAVHVFGQGYPRNVILDSDGKVIYDVHGFSSDSTARIDMVIGSLLNEL